MSAKILKPMLEYSKLKTNEKQFLSLTSLTVSEFDELLIDFDQDWRSYIDYYTFEGKPRMRAYKEKSNALLAHVADKLLFILFYLKNQPLQESIGSVFGMTQPQANQCITLYRMILHSTLNRLKCLPCRNAKTLLKQLSQSDEKEFYTDGVERCIPRNVDWEVQKDQYSGKKKTHTVKNTIFSDANAQIHYLSPTYEGKTHDKKINEQEGIELPSNSRCYQDTGFLGYTPKGENITIIMPDKKPKGGELSEEQKQRNKAIASVRVRVEHVMSGIKRLRVVKDKVRAWVNDFRDQVMEIACGLHNFRLKFRPWSYQSDEKNLQT